MAKKILIVDDEPLLLHALSRTLRSDGAEVMTASSGEDALIEFYGCSYDICFVDIHMGGISGLAVMKKIKELCPRTIVTIMTCYHLDEDTQGIIKETADYFIPKPFDIGQVKAIVKAAPEGIKEEENKPGGVRRSRAWTSGRMSGSHSKKRSTSR